MYVGPSVHNLKGEVQAHMQALENSRYKHPEFVDDYRLLLVLMPATNAPLCLLLIDTEKDVGGGIPVHTSFRLSPHFDIVKHPSLFLERGAHKPSSTDYLTPFYQDPTQRIAVLVMFHRFSYLVFPIEALLKLARNHEGREIGWDGWKKHVTLPSLQYCSADAWVSGCRFFRFNDGPDVEIEVYDFSIRGRVRHQREKTYWYMGAVKCLQATRAKLHIQWHPNDVFVIGGGRGSIVFYRVSALRLSHTA